LEEKHGSCFSLDDLRALNAGAESRCAVVSGSIVLQALLGNFPDMTGLKNWAKSDVDVYVSDVRPFGVSVLCIVYQCSCIHTKRATKNVGIMTGAKTKQVKPATGTKIS
jgi:hypothetical protein